MNEEQLLNAIINYFRDEIFQPHLEELENEYANLNSYASNLFLLPYLSKIIEGEFNAAGTGKALFFARTLSTSINTSFGSHIKKVLVNNGLAQSYGQSRSNIIIFTDQTTDILTGCLLKSGPNTINSGDKSGIRDKLDNLHDVDSRAIGVIYGSHNELNNHYIQLEEDYEIFVGQDFWHRITGFHSFYDDLTVQLNNLAESLQSEGLFQAGLEALTQQVGQSPLFNF